MDDPIKSHVIAEFATGFVSHFEYPPPKPWGSVHNYSPVTSPEGKAKLTAAMGEQICAGKMIGGIGWTVSDVRNFLVGGIFMISRIVQSQKEETL